MVLRRERVLTQYLGSKEYQGMTRLPNFLRILGEDEMNNEERKNAAHLISWVSKKPRYYKTNSISLELKERRDNVYMCPRIKDGCSFYSGWWRIL